MIIAYVVRQSHTAKGIPSDNVRYINGFLTLYECVHHDHDLVDLKRRHSQELLSALECDTGVSNAYMYM